MVAPESDPAAAPRPEHLEATTFIDSIIRSCVPSLRMQPAAPPMSRTRCEGCSPRCEMRSATTRTARQASRRNTSPATSSPAQARIACRRQSFSPRPPGRLGIPARLGFSDVRNHLQSDRLRELMGTDVFVYHGYSELFVGGAWRKATPAFNATLCARFGVSRLEFDGSEDALLHPFSGDGRRQWSTSETAASSPICPWSSCTQR